jgi:Leucine-rich repeat (LRR) protein
MQTEDFYEAAEEVMAMIRNKARPMTGLTSVEESEAESSDRLTHDGSALTEDSFQESTQEPFSRPPSRDGRPLSRLPVRQEDPELVDQLKKYEEHSDLGDILTQSMRSTGPFKTNDQRPHSASSPNRHDYSSSQIGHISQDGIISDLPNVRISRNPDFTEPSNNATEFPSHKSHSSGTSTACSVPTGLSRGSDSRRLIAPDVVAQLIGKQVGNMVFDEENKMWQKVKTPRPAMNIIPSEDSEDDPFASIPDLTVDETKEKKHLDLATGLIRLSLEENTTNNDSLNLSSSKGDRQVEESMTSEQVMRAHDRVHVETAVEDDEEIEHEISLHEDRIQKGTPSRRRNLTITFSSPIASVIQDVAHRESDNSYGTESGLEQSLGNTTVDSVKRGRHGKIRRSISGMTAKSSSRSRSRGVSKNLTAERHAFIPRPVSRIDEQDENTSDEHTGQDDDGQIDTHLQSAIVTAAPELIRKDDLSVVMATPDPVRSAAIFATPIIGQYVGTLSLTPLSEFTMHQVDNSCALEVSYVVGDQYLVTGDGSKKVMSKAVRSLVEKITEVEPFEPDWESMPELDLSNKQLDTLHMLDEFCTTVVTLDASNNAVSHLDGVPQSVRNLRMTHNLLSELTAWRQLTNLQYVDVSNNQIQSLSAFKDLVHLRTLRADNNQITNLDGIKFHDSLQVLRARGNFITHVDFDGTKMQRLTELDLENNNIAAFENSDQLTCLSTLNLQHNRLTSFSLSEGQSLPCLRYLKLSNNDLDTIDLTILPSLRLLHADRNNITNITGFSHCRRLDSLSLREQKGNDTLDTSFLDSACEVRKLFLSGNRLSGFNPRVDFLNLQYLELANCGLQSLVPDIGQLMPNLRFLNINFNAIDDLWPLRYIPRLKKLLAAGNRLSDAAKVAKALAEFPHLARLDLRDNGATLGFYAPVQTLVPVEDDEEAEFDPFILPDVDIERQQKFASRLDMNTRMRKRIYDMVVLNECRQLKMLDGLPAAKDVTSVRDEVWESLVESGIIEKDKKDEQSEEEKARENASTQ